MAAWRRARSVGTRAIRTTRPTEVPASRDALQRGERRAGELEYFERALDPLRVGRREARGRRGIHPGELCMQRGPPLASGSRVEPCAHAGIGPRQRAQALGQRLEVEHRPAGHDRHPAAGANRRDRREGVVAEPRRGVGLGRVDDVDQVMGDARAGRRVGFRRADVHAPVDLRGVDADDLAADALGQRERERALAGRGRAHQ